MTLTFIQGVVLLSLVVGGSLLAGVVVIWGRKGFKGQSSDQAAPIIRSWIAISLVIGLLVFCASAFLVNDEALRSTLFGGLIASVGAAVAFYFSSKATDQALNAAVAMSQGGTPPGAFSQATPPAGTVGTAYTYTVRANGQPPPTYQLVTGGGAGPAPPGLTLETNGTMHGTPQTPGSYTFSIAASNPAGTLLSGPLTIVISPSG